MIHCVVLRVRIGGAVVEFPEPGVVAEPTTTGLLLIHAADGRVIEAAAPGDWVVLDANRDRP